MGGFKEAEQLRKKVINCQGTIFDLIECHHVFAAPFEAYEILTPLIKRYGQEIGKFKITIEKIGEEGEDDVEEEM